MSRIRSITLSRPRGRWLAVTAAAGLAALTMTALPADAAGTFNVRSYGATGNGSTNDTPAIDKAIVAASAAGSAQVAARSSSPPARTSRPTRCTC